MVEDEQGSTVLRRLINRTGEPFVRIGVGAAMRLMGEVFVMGRTIEEAIERMRSPKNNGFKASFDMLGEAARRSEEHTSELQSLMRNSYAVFCLNKTNTL